MVVTVIATTAGIARYSRFYQRELADCGNRELALDGLRGSAALMVATYHMALCCEWLKTNTWGANRSLALLVLGPGGVALFFMLTGYLFWSKACAANGKMNVWKLWRGRLYRIAPLYLFSLLLVLTVAVLETGHHWLSLENWRPMLRLLALGACKWHAVGTTDPNVYNAGVIWTLWYEWRFYLLLPFIAWFAVGLRTFILMFILYLLYPFSFLFHFDVYPLLFFLLGMLCAVLLQCPQIRFPLRHPLAAGLAILLTLVLLFFSPHAFLIGTVLFPVFFVAAAGNSFWGVLTHPVYRCLGAISYSLYLLHGIIFKFVFHFLQTHELTHLPRFDYWLIIAMSALVTTLFCAITYRYIEFPFLSISHRKPAVKKSLTVPTNHDGGEQPAVRAMGKTSNSHVQHRTSKDQRRG